MKRIAHAIVRVYLYMLGLMLMFACIFCGLMGVVGFISLLGISLVSNPPHNPAPLLFISLIFITIPVLCLEAGLGFMFDPRVTRDIADLFVPIKQTRPRGGD